MQLINDAESSAENGEDRKIINWNQNTDGLDLYRSGEEGRFVKCGWDWNLWHSNEGELPCSSYLVGKITNAPLQGNAPTYILFSIIDSILFAVF